MTKTRKNYKRTNNTKTRKNHNGGNKIGPWAWGKQNREKYSKKYTVNASNGNNTLLQCSICKGNHFFLQSAFIRPGRLGSYLDIQWLTDKYAKVAICQSCTNILWFKNGDALTEQK